MSTQDKCCTIVPYFSVADDNMNMFKELCEQFVAKSEQEPKCLYYGFSFDGNQVHCREGYEDASGLLAHLENVGPLLEKALEISEITRLEVHAPAEEIEMLREPLAAFGPQFFCLEYGFRK